MNPLVSFIKKTNELISHLEKGLPKDGREDYIKTIHQLLEERQRCLDAMSDLSSNLEDKTKRELASREERLQALINNQSGKIKQELKILQMKKLKGNQYANPYGHFSVDGMFLDKKK